MQYNSLGRTVFQCANYFFLISLALLCIFPILHVLALSFSSSGAAAAGLVKLWPVDFTLVSYNHILRNNEFAMSFLVTLQRISLAVPLSLFLTILTAYPLSKRKGGFRFRTGYAWIYVFTILFHGGLIPWYLTIRSTGLIDSIWALVLPTAVPVFNIVLMLNFFRGLPKELEESAFMDGAGHWKVLWRIFVPLSLPVIATVTLFTLVNHWNSWFDGTILMNSPENYPLSSYLQSIIVNYDLSRVTAEEAKRLSEVSNRTVKASQIFLAALPIILVYPFLQRYFIKGLVMGSVNE